MILFSYGINQNYKKMYYKYKKYEFLLENVDVDCQNLNEMKNNKKLYDQGYLRLKKYEKFILNSFEYNYFDYDLSEIENECHGIN